MRTVNYLQRYLVKCSGNFAILLDSRRFKLSTLSGFKKFRHTKSKFLAFEEDVQKLRILAFPKVILFNCEWFNILAVNGSNLINLRH